MLLAMPHTRQVPALKECATLRGWLGRSSAGPWTDSTRWRGRSAASRRQFGLGFNRHLLSKLATGRARSHVTATPMRSTGYDDMSPETAFISPIENSFLNLETLLILAPHLGARRFSHECAGSRSCHIKETNRLSEALPPPSLPGYKVQRMTDWMAEHVAEDSRPCSAGGSSQGLASFTFIALFKSAIGVSPSRYHINLRMDAARRLLRETKKSVCGRRPRGGLRQSQPFRAALPPGNRPLPERLPVGSVNFSR